MKRPSPQWLRYAAVALFLVALVVSRGCRLGDKPLHHDESLFGYYSHYFAVYGEYQYDPILHGPLLIELSAGVFRLFGDNNTTLRMVSFYAGLILLALLLLLRRWLGRAGLILALLILLLSPNLCYYARYQREDVLFLMLTVLNLAAIAWTLRSDYAWPIVLWPLSLALLISNKENVVFVLATQIGFATIVVMLDYWRIAASSRADEDRWPLTRAEKALAVLKRINISLLLWLLIAWAYAIYIKPYIDLGHFGKVVWIGGVLVTAALLTAVLRAARDNPTRFGLVFRLYERLYCDRYWWIVGVALAAAWIYFAFSICFTQPRPLFGLLAQTVAYWWGEHASERLGGPFHIYAPQILLYEAPAWVILFAALIRDWTRHGRKRFPEIAIWLAPGLLIWIASIVSISGYVDFLGRLPDWVAGLLPDPPNPSGQNVVIYEALRWTWFDYLSQMLHAKFAFLHVGTLGALYWALSILYWGVLWTARSILHGRLARAYFIFWLATSYLFYGYAGEKVPWLALHIILPLWLTAAVLWNEWFATRPSSLKRYAAVAAVGVLLAWNSWQTVRVCFLRPTDPAEILIYNHTQPETQEMAWQVLGWIDTGAIAPESVAVQGEASWPLTWYFRNRPEVRFELDDYVPSPLDEAVFADPGVENRATALRQEFAAHEFPLRAAWVPPSIPFNEILCLRHIPGEPKELGGKLKYRLRRSAAIVWPVIKYIAVREPYNELPPQPYPVTVPVTSVLWVRERSTPELPIPPE